MDKLDLPEFGAEPTPASPRATLVFGGDFCPIGRFEERILSSGDVFDSSLRAVFAQSDFAMLNQEAVLCEPELTADDPSGFGLRADPRVAGFLLDTGITAVGLANNHIRDFGDEGVRRTMQHLDRAGILHTGAGMNLAAAEQPLMMEVNGLKLAVWALAEKELNVASAARAGSSWFRPERDAERVRELRASCDFLVVFLHAGHEFIGAPSPRIRESCRALADAGADAVVAHHPHVIQGVERRGEALIAYSLGNLVFDSPYVSAYKGTDAGFLLRLEIAPHCVCRAAALPYLLHEDATVAPPDAAGCEAFAERLRDLSAVLSDEPRFWEEWQKNVRFRWETSYERALRSLSKRLSNPDDRAFVCRARNLFACPTHTEMLEQALLMLEQGKLARSAMPEGEPQ